MSNIDLDIFQKFFYSVFHKKPAHHYPYSINEKIEFMISFKLSKVTNALGSWTEIEPESLTIKTMFFAFCHELCYNKPDFHHLQGATNFLWWNMTLSAVENVQCWKCWSLKCYNWRESKKLFVLRHVLSQLKFPINKAFKVSETINIRHTYFGGKALLLHVCRTGKKQNNKAGTSLVTQWLRIHLPMQGTQVRALVQEDPTCRGATKPVCHNY